MQVSRRRIKWSQRSIGGGSNSNCKRFVIFCDGESIPYASRESRAQSRSWAWRPEVRSTHMRWECKRFSRFSSAHFKSCWEESPANSRQQAQTPYCSLFRWQGKRSLRQGITVSTMLNTGGLVKDLLKETPAQILPVLSRSRGGRVTVPVPVPVLSLSRLPIPHRRRRGISPSVGK